MDQGVPEESAQQMAREAIQPNIDSNQNLGERYMDPGVFDQYPSDPNDQ